MWNIWTSNCYWNIVMFTLHTSALMKVWLSTVKVFQGKATISCWLNWLGSCEWEAFTSTYHMGWHCVKRRQTPFQTGQPKGCSDRTAIMTKCVVVVRSRRAQKQTNKKQHTIRVVWIWSRSIIAISRWFQGSAAPTFWQHKKAMLHVCMLDGQTLCRLKGLVSWEAVATDANFWNSLLPAFLAFNLFNVMWFLNTELGLRLVFLPLCLKQGDQCVMQGWPWPWPSL